MTRLLVGVFARSFLFPLAFLLLPAGHPAGAAAEDAAQRGAAVTVIKASRACFNNVVQVSGIVMPREETAVRPDRPGLRVAEVMVDAGDAVTAGQVLARLDRPEGGSVNVTAPVAGVISESSATMGALASARGEALFNIIANTEFDLVGQVPTEDLGKLAPDQPARISIIGAGDVQGTVRRVAPTVEPNSQLGQVVIGITTSRRFLVNSSGRAQIRTGRSCGLSVPLTAVLYSTAGTVVQVVKSGRIETKRVEVGLTSGGNVEIREGLSEGDNVVARAGALFREGDLVRPFVAGVELK